MSLIQRTHNLNSSNKRTTPAKKLEYSFEEKTNSKQSRFISNVQDKNKLKENITRECLIKKLQRENEDLIEELDQVTNQLQIKSQQLKQYKLQNKKLKLSLNHALNATKDLEKSKFSNEKNANKVQQQFSSNKEIIHLKETLNKTKQDLQQKRKKLRQIQPTVEQLTKQIIKLRGQNEILLNYKKQISISERQIRQIEQIMINNQKNYKQQLQKNTDYIEQLNRQLMQKEKKIGQLEIVLLEKENQILQLQQFNQKLQKQEKSKGENIEKLLNQYQETLRYACQTFDMEFKHDLSLKEILTKTKNLLKNSNELLSSQRSQYAKQIHEYQVGYKQKQQLLQQQIRFLKVQLDSNVNFEKNIGKQLNKIGSNTNIFQSVRGKKSEVLTNIYSSSPSTNFESKRRSQSASMMQLSQLKRHNSLSKFLYSQQQPLKQAKVSMEQLLYKKCKQIIF